MLHLKQMSDEELDDLYADLDSREYSFTDADVDTMTAIRAEQARRKSELEEGKTMDRNYILAALAALQENPRYDSGRDFGTGWRQGIFDLAATLIVPNVPLSVARRALVVIRNGGTPDIAQLVAE